MRLRPATNRPAPEGSSCDLEDVSLHHSCLIPHHYHPRTGGGSFSRPSGRGPAALEQIQSNFAPRLCHRQCCNRSGATLFLYAPEIFWSSRTVKRKWILCVEYKPCVVPASCWDLMREFLQGFLGSSVQNTAPQYLQNRINEVYQPIDTIQQYLDQFMLYRKATGVL
uniref:Mediator of RNA polymerase II transcription subunit 20 n=1 Tax=Timema genevievae TaxID=629358 RepID=A0A7R9JWD8_TIMGE|nr:unnamed protein product [Timema genevievae]